MMIRAGLLGEKLGHSYSPQIHGMLGEYSYELFEKSPEELEDFIRNGNWTGLNVTIPYKKTVLPWCSELSEIARASGSVNTLVKSPDGRIFGDNTDAFGFSCMLKRQGVDPKGMKTLILGNGGAAASVRTVLAGLGAKTVVISRKAEKAEETYEGLSFHKDARLIVNTTPVGMYPHNGESLLDPSDFPDLAAVLDIIYNPSRTALLMDAEKAGIPVQNGLYMLIAQAKKSSELFTGKEIPEERIDQIERILSSQMQNIVLIGMPGCGKSTLARHLAEMTGRKVEECDRIFEETFGISPGDYILRYGEESFRKKETEVLYKVGALSGRIISTGGGCVTVPENYPLLHQNGVIFWILRDPRLLTKKGRPLSQKTDPSALYEIRRPMYEGFADFSVENKNSAKEAAETIRKKMGLKES